MRNKVFQRILDETPQDVKIFVDWYADLVVLINQLLRDQGINKKDLAEKLDKSPSEISKWLNGEHNFTLRSLAKLSVELGEPLLVVPKKRDFSDFINSTPESKFQVYVKRKDEGIAKTSEDFEKVAESSGSSTLNYA